MPAKKLQTGYSFIYNEIHTKIVKWFDEHPDKDICNINDIDN